jgi:hypothetical protein
MAMIECCHESSAFQNSLHSMCQVCQDFKKQNVIKQTTNKPMKKDYSGNTVLDVPDLLVQPSVFS